jgi:hypothetical protein
MNRIGTLVSKDSSISTSKHELRVFTYTQLPHEEKEVETMTVKVEGTSLP